MPLVAANLGVTKQIQQTEARVQRFYDLWKPQASNALQGFAQDIGKWFGQFPYQQDTEGRKFYKTDVPQVAVKRALEGYITWMEDAETQANLMLTNEIRALSRIATSKTPAREAKKQEKELKDQTEFRGSRPLDPAEDEQEGLEGARGIDQHSRD